MLAKKNQYIDSAYKQLQVISQDKQKRLEYEAREKAIRDYNQLIYEARESGKQEGRQEGAMNEKYANAKNFIALGLPTETIAQGVGLSPEIIENIRIKNDGK